MMLARGLCLLVLALPAVIGDSSVLPSPDPETYPDFGSSVVFCVGDGALLAAATDSASGAKAYHAFAYNTATWEPKQVITLPVGFQPHAAACSAGGSTVLISGTNAATDGEVHVFTTTDLDTPYVQNATLTDDALGTLLHDTIGIPADGAYLLIGRDLTGEKRVVTYELQNSIWAAVNVLDLPGNPQQSPLLALSSDGLTGVFLTAGTAVAHQWVGQQWTVLQTVATPSTTVSARLTSNGQFLAVARPEVGCEIHQFNSGTGQYELSYTATWPNLEAVIGITDAATAVVTVTDAQWVVWNYQSPQWVVVQTVPLFTQQTVATHSSVPFVGAPCDSSNSGGECEEPAVVVYDLTLCWGYGTCFSGRGQCVTSSNPEPTARCNCSVGPGRFGGPFCERCTTGFDNSRNCLDCLTTRYGPNCSEEISCDTEHGECPEGLCWGLTGHGLCSTCDKLYYGSACDGEVLCIAENGVCEENECWGVNGTGLCSSCNGGMHALPRCSYKSWMLSLFIFGGLGVLTIAFGAYHVNRYKARSAMTLLP